MREWENICVPSGRYQVSRDGRVRSLRSGKEMSLAKTEKGYIVVSLYCDGWKKLARVHQLVLEAFVGPRPDGYVADHIDNNKKNNHVDNLRWVTLKQNAYNSSKPRDARCTSEYKGVSKTSGGRGRKPWRARIKVDGACLHLGCFKTQEEAHEAYCKAAKEHFGEYANMG